jgi:DNA-binding transcriptional MerR regulator
VTELGIKDICTQASVTPRTVHFYIQQGLLAPPDGAGRGARYTQAHLARLQLIKRLQKEHLPLNEIRRQLTPLSESQVVQALSRGTPTSLAFRESAAQYIQSVKSSAGSRDRMPSAWRPMMDAVASLASESPTPSPVRHSQWERIALNDDLELHIRRPLSRERNRLVDKLLAFAKQMSKEEQS